MFIESVFDSTKGLSYILFSTTLTGEAIDHVGASAADVFHAVVLLLCIEAANISTFVEEFAVFAQCGVAERESSFFVASTQWFRSEERRVGKEF